MPRTKHKRPEGLITGTKESAAYHLQARGGKIIWSERRKTIARALIKLGALSGVDGRSIEALEKATKIPVARLKKYVGPGTEMRLAGIIGLGAKTEGGDLTYYLTRKGKEEVDSLPPVKGKKKTKGE